LEIEEYKSIIEKYRTIYVYGIYEDGTPYLIIHTEKKFKPRLRSEGYVKITTKPPLVIIEIRLRQYRIMEDINIVVLPLNQEIRRFVDAIGDKKTILLSLTGLEEFREIYKSIVDRGFIEDKDYNAVTFEIPIEDLNELKQLMKIIDIIDREFMRRLEEILIEKQKRELEELRIHL